MELIQIYAFLTLDTRENGSLLNSGRLLKTISVHSSEEILLQAHVIETVYHCVPVGLE